jgi:hypothetical protein
VEYQSTSVVLFPATPTDTKTQASSHTIETQIQIALSAAVLGPAGAAIEPRLDASQVGRRVEVTAPSTDVLAITARGATADDAEGLARAVANADVAYLQQAAGTLTEDQKAALTERMTTLKASLEAVQGELAKTSDRLKTASPNSTAGSADAAALAQLTAREAELVLQLDGVAKELADGSRPGGRATVIQQASPAVHLPEWVRGAMYAALGCAAALSIIAPLVIVRERRRKTLRMRDQIADSVGVPVVASVQCRAPRSVAGWAKLLESYAPGSVDAWSLRQLLTWSTSSAPAALGDSRNGVRHRPRPLPEDGPPSTRIVVLSLAGDQPALSVGPQLASFAAGDGARTLLVTTAQPHDADSSLTAATSSIGLHQQPRPGLFVASEPNPSDTSDLTVYVVPVDRLLPEPFLSGVHDAVTILAVSAGAASAEDLARVALGAHHAGLVIDGLVVANPDAFDRTTGRLLPAERAVLAPLPSLMTGQVGPDKPTVPVTRWSRQ